METIRERAERFNEPPQPWLPVKLRPVKSARGWKPASGWYPWRGGLYQQADVSARFATKAECLAECARRNEGAGSKTSDAIRATRAEGGAQ